MFYSNTSERANGFTSNILSGAPDTPSGTCTAKPLISSFTSPAPTSSSSRVISTTASSRTTVLRPRRLHSISPLAPWLAPLVHQKSALCVPSRATSLSVSRTMRSPKSWTRKSPAGKSAGNTCVLSSALIYAADYCILMSIPSFSGCRVVVRRSSWREGPLRVDSAAGYVLFLYFRVGGELTYPRCCSLPFLLFSSSYDRQTHDRAILFMYLPPLTPTLVFLLYGCIPHLFLNASAV